ncbi:MAG: DUF1385 domain-containing protein [Firmicutes bacterium]|jgi:uncharacterized protein YqhQ|nr:DUF1385 domain-containing protein [Bacillota bacterium]
MSEGICKTKKFASVGGQALIEGVMMRGQSNIAIAVRKSDGEIVLKKDPVKKVGSSFFKLPLIRGMYALVSSMVVGIKALTYSAEFFEEADEVKETKFDLFLKKIFKEKTDDVLVFFSMLFAIIMALFLFTFLPTFLIATLRAKVTNPIYLSAFEGVLKIALFVAYILLISRMNDVKRVFQYHGAEHKTIHCLESGKELTVENCREFSTLHPRCGTSFLLIVLVISITIFSFVSWTSPVMRVVWKIVLLPVVAGVSFEVLKWTGKGNSSFAKIISKPGMMMQKLTTNEPDDKQLEVAIAALKHAIEDESDVLVK